MEKAKKKNLEVIDFSGYSNNIPLFENISFSLDVGKILVIYGPRGSSKSALLRSFSRLNEEVYDDIKYDGTVNVCGKNLFDYDVKELRNDVLYIDTNFFEALDYLKFGEFLELATNEELLSFENYISILDDFGVLKTLSKGFETKLSDFYVLEKILTLLFVGYLKNSKIVILDCILDHLDDDHLKVVSKILKKNMVSARKTLIVATRFFKRFLPIADLFISLKSGKIEFVGEPKDYTIVR
ncbi:cobalamin ABC transporter ATPase [Thermosipho melanesiensis]|uniref:ABC-type cobalamin/Fe3+-siderophores transport systems ATPase components-like protein n=2 Tax=Thermosipho melanesiensis TaxID=46541 RepID=A6LKU0_THEM4|nr:ATP-binding cassette domain-containing protein [Thermosipho melanesiensis]ABR30541.1 ABC-type cobalamin/Fe3+-siderophores transport systems ATPase components-like protein [Thermosipho melanesiensis BI429]APT73690.1 cobalamin ABC transporter ATPase [Thermosipho melanesiensis]OOC35629.1 cobalamin ABC transporter ATPase [Thermosipho melanesiensis]OOC39304.1 cobalamin ABC transporter ATPase [Thermosipho melanesiensis]OOC39390.1 cobalamin ABC transporter ATPase [Thermosipho melanesiensis]